MGESDWKFLISDRLRLDANVKYDKGEPTEFGINLCGLINGEWVDLIRYDNAHGPAHRHHFRPDGTDEIHTFVAVLTETFIDRAQRELKANADEYLDEYERRLSNMNRGAR